MHTLLSIKSIKVTMTPSINVFYGVMRSPYDTGLLMYTCQL